MAVKKITTAPVPADTEILTAMPAYEAPAAAVDIKLDQRAMVAIVVQRASESWEHEQSEATAEAARIQREITSQETRLAVLVDAVDHRDIRDKGEAVLAALAGLGILGNLGLTVGALDFKTFTIAIAGKIEIKTGGYGRFEFEESLSATPAMRETVARLAELSAEKAAHVEVASTARRNLADVPKLERWAEAQIAELVLGRSAGGQDWLNALGAKLRQRVDMSALKRQLKLIG
jgi:hypothetical protein